MNTSSKMYQLRVARLSGARDQVAEVEEEELMGGGELMFGCIRAYRVEQRPRSAMFKYQCFFNVFTTQV